MRSRRWHPDVIVGCVVFAFGLFIIITATQIAPAASRSSVVGPSVMPMAVGAVLAASALALTAKGAWSMRRDSSGPTAPDASVGPTGTSPENGTSADSDAAENEEAPLPGKVRRFAILTVLMLAYILAFIPVGYLISTFAFVAAASSYIDPRKWPRNVVFAGAFAVVVYFAFTEVLHVSLPPGLVG